MHNRPIRPDPIATKAAKFLSCYSYVSFRIHPGTEESVFPQQCVYLAGADVGMRREEVFERDGNRCMECGTTANLQMAHGGNTKVSRCECMQNLKTKCYACHILKEHAREPQLGRRYGLVR